MAKDFKKTNGHIDKGFVFELAERLWNSESGLTLREGAKRLPESKMMLLLKKR